MDVQNDPGSLRNAVFELLHRVLHVVGGCLDVVRRRSAHIGVFAEPRLVSAAVYCAGVTVRSGCVLLRFGLAPLATSWMTEETGCPLFPPTRLEGYRQVLLPEPWCRLGQP